MIRVRWSPRTTCLAARTVPRGGVSKKKILYSRTKFVSMESLIKGAATRQDWMLVIGFNLVMISFAMVFLAVGLILLPQSRDFGFSPRGMFFIVFALLMEAMIIRVQYKDYKETRGKLKRKAMPRKGTT